MISNDTVQLTPYIPSDGPHLVANIPGLQIGIAEYKEGPTGCTLFYFPRGATTAVDARGGSVGIIGGYPWNHAICIAGGSLYGLEAATGVSAELFAQRGFDKRFPEIALVSGAIIYDFGPRDNAIYPDKVLGRAAMRAALHAGSPARFLLGKRGAGCSATVGKGIGPAQSEAAGQGAAYRQIGETKIAAFTVVNAMGVIVNRAGEVVRGQLDPTTGKRHVAIVAIEQGLADTGEAPPPGNTTITVVVTNQKLSSRSLNQFARQVHSSMARAIQPFQTIDDGDVLFAVTTNEVDNPHLYETSLGIIASEVLWDAVLSIASIP